MMNIGYAGVRELHEAALEQWMLGNDATATAMFREITLRLERINGNHPGINRDGAPRSDQADQDGRDGAERSGDQSGAAE